MRRTSFAKNILGLLIVFVIVFFVDSKVVVGDYNIPPTPNDGVVLPYVPGGYTEGYILDTYCEGEVEQCDPGTIVSGTWQGVISTGQTYAGFYEAPNGNYYPIGIPDVPAGNTGSGGGGPEDDGEGTCTGVYSTCTGWGACSPTCGAGTQDRTCFDTGCGSPQTQSQACMINDPTVWGAPTTCTVQCGGGTQERTNQCGTTETIACNTSVCPAWTKLKDSSFVSTDSLGEAGKG